MSEHVDRKGNLHGAQPILMVQVCEHVDRGEVIYTALNQ